MEGVGFLIWKIEQLKPFTPAEIATKLADYGIRWVSIKISEGANRYNQVGGNDKILLDYMIAFEQAGLRVGGWSYVYPEKPGAQAGVIAERVAKFSNHVKFDHVMLDVEKEWKQANATAGAIETLLAIDVSKKFPFYYCSYRYPSLHYQVNHAKFLRNATISHIAPQVYWLGADNPVEQLERSYNEYRKLSDKPFMPIGCTFNFGNWTPSLTQLEDYVRHCISRKWYTYGFYSLDWIIKHDRWDMVEAITGKIITPPPAIPTVAITRTRCNPRTSPVIHPSTDAGMLESGYRFKITGQPDGDWIPVEMWLHKSVVVVE